MDPPSSLQARGRLVGSAAVVGILVGVGAFFVATIHLEGLQQASTKSFALGALVFAFGLIAWAGSVIAGPGYEAMQRHLDMQSNWTEAKSRRAMARITGFGAGWMVGTAVAASALGV